MKKNSKNIYSSGKRIVITIVLIFILLSMFFIYFANKMQVMNKLDYNITLNDDGSIDIVETWDIHIGHTNTLFRTFEKNNKFGNIENVEIKDLKTGKNLKQIYKEMYHVTTDCYYALDINSHQFEVAWGTGMENKVGKKKYQFSYTITDVITDYNDCQELYWKLLDESNGIPVKKVTGTINLPSNVKNIDNLKVWGHGPLNGKIEIESNNTVKFSINGLNRGRMLEIRTVTLDKMFNVNTTKIRKYNYLEQIRKEEAKWSNETNKDTKTFYVIIAIMYIIAIIINIVNSIGYYKLSRNKDDGIIHTNLKYYREIPREKEATPAQASYLYFFDKDEDKAESYQSNFVAATILNLSLKKYISLRVNQLEVYIKILKDKDINFLSDDEYYVYELLRKAGKKQEEFEISEINTFAKKRYYEYSNLINKLINASRESLYKNKLVDKANKKKYAKSKNAKISFEIVSGIVEFALIMFLISLIPMFDISYIAFLGAGYRRAFLVAILILTPLIISILVKLKFLSKAQSKIAVLTQKGTEEQEQWKALANYMKDFSLLDEKDVPSLAIWEKYLVYATAFGISDKVITQMKAKYPEVFVKEYWEDEKNIGNYEVLRFATNNIVYNNYVGSSPITTLSRSAQRAYNTSLSEIAAHQSSGSSGGGGGFSGGGRWPVVVAAGMGR